MALTREVKTGLVTAAATLAVGILTLNQAHVGVLYDDGLYAGLAAALAGGHGYVHPNLPGMPAGVRYPPLYPALLAPLFGLFSVETAASIAKVLNALLNAGAAGLIAWYAAQRELLGPKIPRWTAGVIVFAAAAAIPVLMTQGVLFSEPLFSVLAALAVIETDRGAPPERPWLAGTVGALALLTRSIAVALIAGLAGALILRRAPRRVVVAVLVPGVIAALGWGLWVTTNAHEIDPALGAGYGTYLAHARQAGLSAVTVNIPDLSRPLEALTLGWIPVPWLYGILAMVSLAVGLYGLWLVSQRSSVGLPLVFYFLILAVWPHPPDRFLWAVLPWLALIFAAGLFEAGRRWRQARVPALVLGLLVVGGYLQYEYRGFRGQWWEGQARAVSATFADLLPVIKTLPDSAVIATDDEGLVWLYSGRRAVPFYLESYHGRESIRTSPAEQRAYLERMHVSHILLASSTSPSAIELRELIGAYPSWLAAIYRWPDGRWLFAVNRGK